MPEVASLCNDESSEFENQYCGDSIEAWMGYSAFIGGSELVDVSLNGKN